MQKGNDAWKFNWIMCRVVWHYPYAIFKRKRSSNQSFISNKALLENGLIANRRSHWLHASIFCCTSKKIISQNYIDTSTSVGWLSGDVIHYYVNWTAIYWIYYQRAIVLSAFNHSLMQFNFMLKYIIWLAFISVVWIEFYW